MYATFNSKVVLGGGRKSMIPITEADPEHPHKVGLRMDGRNLIKEWLNTKDSHRASYVWNKHQFDKLDPDGTDHLIGSVHG
jgi:alkaline phosphatase